MMAPPILIAAPTRTGTTMLAWLLHLHGVWIGEGNITRSPETNPQVPTENIAIKRYLRGVVGLPETFREDVLALVETDGRWLVKSAAVLNRRDAFFHFFPDAHWLLPWRPPAEIIASKMRHPGMKGRGEEWNERITLDHQAAQQDIARRAERSQWFDVGTVASGGTVGAAVARQVFEFVGVEFDRGIYDQWVQPERWHGA